MSRSPNLRHLSRSQRFARAVFCVLASAAVASLSVLVGLSTSGSAQAAAPVGQGFNLNAGDLRFMLTQIKIAEAHAAGGQLLGSGPFQVSSPLLPLGSSTPYGYLAPPQLAVATNGEYAAYVVEWTNELPGPPNSGSDLTIFQLENGKIKGHWEFYLPDWPPIGL